MENAVVTLDGSLTLFNERTGEHYHATQGAKSESLYVYIQNGIQSFVNQNPTDKLQIIEVGFGTGLNAILALDYAIKNNISINYITCEPYPLKWEDLHNWEIPAKSGLSELQSPFEKMHLCPSTTTVELHPNFTFTKYLAPFQTIPFVDKETHIIFFDAFSPDVEPTLWDHYTLERTYRILCENGLLVTYCAKGTIKRSLKNIGFQLIKTAGALGKREMIKAVKI